MMSGIKIGQAIIWGGIFLFLSLCALAGERSGIGLPAPAPQEDSLLAGAGVLTSSPRFIHGLEVDIRPGYIFPTNPFLQGMNGNRKAMRSFYAAHVKYSLQFSPHTLAARVYGGAYQGFGMAQYTFGNKRELGNPVALYLFQGARIVSFAPRLSFNYEWNFGLSLGWKHYVPEHNRYNIMMGSKLNAYINTNFYLNWMLSPQFDLRTGITLTHFSNGNTRFPNAGINMVGGKVGLVYHLNRHDKFLFRPVNKSDIPKFPRHMSYDLAVFGSWRRKGYINGDEFVPSPLAYKVVGINFAAMYNVSYKFRAGAALDGVYDASANVFVLKSPTTNQGFVKPPFNAQIALGVSGRVEYVMPYFIVGIGMGTNVLHRGGDLKAFYQMLVLKIAVTRNSFLHVGYCLQEFRTPNFLMLGIGFRFNNKYPVLNH